MNIVAIIPARGGSKRIPGKNKKEFFGKPLINYSIEAARDTGLFNRIIVSTDSDEIAGLAKAAGAETPFLRPAHLADDHTVLSDVLMHALKWLETNDQNQYSYVCCILATAPFIQAAVLKEAYVQLTKSKARAVVPVTSFPYPIMRSLKMDAQGRLAMNWPEHEKTRSNDLAEAYHDVGQFYWLRVSDYLRDNSWFAIGAEPIFIPRYLAQDLDTPEDWETAEKMYQILFREKVKR